MSESRVPSGPDGYRIVLPQGWTQLDVRADINATVAGALAGIPFERAPRDDRARLRAAIEGRLRTAIADAKKVDAYALYVCLQGMRGIAIPASFVIGQATDFSGGGPEGDVLAQLLTAPGAQPVVIDGSDGVRTESVATGVDEASGQRMPARQLTYVLPVPNSTDWLLAVFDVIGDETADEQGQALIGALLMLFDAVMSTFRWQFA